MINISREAKYVATQLGYFGKSIMKNIGKIQSTLGEWNSDDQATLKKMQDIIDAMSNLVSSADELRSIKTDDLKHGSADKWSGSYKSKTYDKHVDDIEKMIKKCRETVGTNLSNGVTEITRLQGKLHFPWNGGSELQQATRIYTSFDTTGTTMGAIGASVASSSIGTGVGAGI